MWIFLFTYCDEQGKDPLEIRKGVALEIEYISMKIIENLEIGPHTVAQAGP